MAGIAERPRTALITGASSGIGYELAVVFARHGYRLVVVARGEARLNQLAQMLQARHGASVTVLACDLSRPSAPGEVLQGLAAASIEVDVLVNNAGFGMHGLFAQGDPDEQLRLLQVNMVAVTQLTRLLLPAMLARRDGKILNVASTAAFQPGPMMALYYASKAYVLSFAEALADELRGTGVTATVLCPGPTRTEFQERAKVANTKLMQGRIMTAVDVALAGYEGLARGKTLVIPGFRNKLLAFAVRLAPRALVTRAVRGYNNQRTAR